MIRIRKLLFTGFVTCAVLFLPVSYIQADELGRLFLTSGERARLEKLRYAEPEPVAPVIEVEVPEPVDLTLSGQGETELPEIVLQKVPVLTQPLVLKGVVRRSNGKNAAWLNDTNTLDGDSVMQDVRIHESDIDNDSVKIKLPDNVTEITLKVGQTYEPGNTSGGSTE